MKSSRGTMVVSLDLELSWGRFDKLPIDTVDAESFEERKNIKRLLTLLDQYKIPATWAIVGHLMLDSCRRDQNGDPHTDIQPHARYSWFPHDWYCCDPCTNVWSAPGWYAPDILEWIRQSQVAHDIGSHSFAHIIYGDSECSQAVARADLSAVVKAAAKKECMVRSFIFPRNQVGHLQLLKEFGFRAYRGPDPPHILLGANSILRKALTALDHFLGFPPRLVRAGEVMSGLWNIPGNHFYLHRQGSFRYLPIWSRVLKGKRGINRAVKTAQLYHLWFHPFNLNSDSDAMFAGLENIFSYACRQRDKGLLDILTMNEYAQRLEEGKSNKN